MANLYCLKIALFSPCQYHIWMFSRP